MLDTSQGLVEESLDKSSNNSDAWGRYPPNCKIPSPLPPSPPSPKKQQVKLPSSPYTYKRYDPVFVPKEIIEKPMTPVINNN